MHSPLGIPQRVVIQAGIGLGVNGLGIFIRVFPDPAPSHIFQPLDKSSFSGVNAFFIINISGGIGKRHDLCTQFDQFFDGVLRHISGAGDQATSFP